MGTHLSYALETHPTHLLILHSKYKSVLKEQQTKNKESKNVKNKYFRADMTD